MPEHPAAAAWAIPDQVRKVGALKRALAFILVLIVLGGLVGGLSYFQFVFKPQMVKQFIAGMKPPASAVAVARAETQSWTGQVRAIGTFKPVQGIDIAPQVGGIVQAIHFDSSQEVDKGAVLVEIDPSTERADLASGMAQMRNADLSLTRQKELVTGGNTSRATVDQAQATRDTAAATVDRARAIIAQKTLVAPFPGRLGIRKVDVGQYVSPGTPLVSLTQLDPIYVDFTVPEQTLASIRVGQKADIGVDGFADRFAGAVTSVDSRVSQDSRSVVVRAQVANPDKKLLPGMFANVAVLSGDPRDVVTVPRTAVTFSLYGDSVLVVKPAPAPAGSAPVGAAQAAEAPSASLDLNADLVVEQRFVRMGDVRGDRVSILDGLKAGDTVVSEGQVKLMPGAHVTVASGGGMPARPVLPRQ